MALLLLVIALIIYLIPFIVVKRDHPYFWPIVIINVFFGWTLIGWLVALIWAQTECEPYVKGEKTPAAASDVVAKLKELESMLKSGTITEQEFSTLKSKVIGNP